MMTDKEQSLSPPTRSEGLVLAHRLVGSDFQVVPAGLLPALDRPLISWVLEDLWDQGVKRLLLTVGKGAPLIERHFERDRRFAFEIRSVPVNSATQTEEILTRLRDLRPDVVAEAAALRSHIELSTHAGPLPAITSLAEYRRQLLAVIQRVDWNPGLPGARVDRASIVENRADEPVGRRNPGCYIGCGSLVDRRSHALDSVLHRNTALLGDCDIARCVVMPGTILRDTVARDAVLGFDQWAAGLNPDARGGIGRAGAGRYPGPGPGRTLLHRAGEWARFRLRQLAGRGADAPS